MKKIILIVLCVFLSQSVMAAMQLTDIKIEDDVLYFTTSENASVIASCVLTDNKGKWAFNMQSVHGKGMYLALMTAAASGQKISVTSANDCNDKYGFERPLSVKVFSH